jgi:hypothetical protein
VVSVAVNLDKRGDPAPDGRSGLAGRVVGVLPGWRPTLAVVRAVVRSAVTTFVVLTATLWLMPGVKGTDVLDTLWLVVLVAAVGAVLRPLLLAGVTALGGLGAMLLGAGAQVIVMAVALRLDPADHITGIPATVSAAVMAVVFAALVNWLADAGTDDAFVGESRRLMRRVRRRTQARQPGPRPAAGPGVIVVQLDGVPEPVLRWAIRAGNLPTIGGWLRERSHLLRGWHTGLPATTPAAQAGILHGDTHHVPAFRWYEKDTRRLIVTRVPRDAAEIEARISTGNGLLRDGGVSISNAFTGDAPTSLLTVSRAAFPGRTARGWATFMASPYGFTRALVLGVAEMVTELHQARLQRRRNLHPRVSRLGAFLALRPAAMLLRDVNVSLIAEQMAQGAPVIFCDLVDYDEVAHHAGPARPEALRALENLDHMLGVLQRLQPHAARGYHLVVLSDHGQSQGAPFRQQYGETLEQLIARLAGDRHAAAPVVAADSASAEIGPPGPPPVNGRVAATRVSGRVTTDMSAAGVSADPAANAPLVVVASGNLAMVYLTGQPGKLTRAQVDAAHPTLIGGLAAHPGIGVVVVDEDRFGPVAYGRGGWHRLRDGTIHGQDPLTPYGPRARRDLLRHQQMNHVGDLVLISTVDPTTDEVPAFEELVGSHGGLGGWQTEAILIHPADWPITDHELDGPAAVHHQLATWLEHLSLRNAAQPATPPAVGADPSPDHPRHQPARSGAASQPTRSG